MQSAVFVAMCIVHKAEAVRVRLVVDVCNRSLTQIIVPTNVKRTTDGFIHGLFSFSTADTVMVVIETRKEYMVPLYLSNCAHRLCNP